MFSPKIFTRLPKFQTKLDHEGKNNVPTGDHSAVPLVSEKTEQQIFNELEKNQQEKDIGQNMTLEKIENLSPYDVLNHFNKHVFPGIKANFFGVPVKTKRAIHDLFSKKKDRFEKYENSIYKDFGAEVAKGIFELVVGNNTHDIKRINLFLEVMFAEMETTAYCNAWLNFNNCAKIFESEGAKDKSRIIEESLKLCDKKFWKGFTTIQFTDDHLIFENGYGTTIQSKEDFFKKK